MPGAVDALTIGRGGVRARIAALGATLRSFTVEDDRDGTVELVAYGPQMLYGGATVGRYANRIAGAQFELDGVTYRLVPNEGRNQLHGGPHGFDKAQWTFAETASDRARLELVSPDGDQGFPGELRVAVTFAIKSRGLRVSYEAVTSAPTVLNLSNHSYFNVSANGAPASQHTLQIFADAYTPVDAQLIPTGEIANVAGTRYDFRTAKTIGGDLFDTNWVLQRDAGAALHRAAILSCEGTNRMLELLTTEPGLQMYSGNAEGIALETQHFPDSPHHPQFPSTVLRPGERFTSTTLYRVIETT